MSADQPAPRPCALATAVAIALSPTLANAQGAIEEIVVTATKREESMQDLPVAMTALQSDALEELRIGSFQDYVQFLPNVVAQGTGPGQNEIFIRGAATSSRGFARTAGHPVRRQFPGRHRPTHYQQTQPHGIAGRVRRELRDDDRGRPEHLARGLP